MRLLSIPFVPAALVLSLFAFVALNLASGLRHVGQWTMLGCAVLLGTHAAGLATRRRVSWIFAIALLAVAAAGCLWMGGRLAFEGLTWKGADGWGRLGLLFAIPYGLAIAAFGAACAVLAWRLARDAGELEGGRDTAAWSGALVGALISLAELGWMVVYQYHHRKLPEQNACVGGRVLSCADLSRKSRIFDEDDRRDFARLGCGREHLDSCHELLKLLRPRHDAGSAEVQAIAATCETGMASLCKGLGLHLLSTGDLQQGGKYLALSCERAPGTCSSSATALAPAGDAALARTLLESGCRRDDARSCRVLLGEHGAGMPTEAREKLEMRLCLIGNFADCRSPMARDLPGTCARLCSLQSTRWFCVQCAQEAAKRGQPELARQHLEAQCSGGYRTACESLQRPPVEPRRSR